MFAPPRAVAAIENMGVWASASGHNGEPIRKPRDRLTGQPRERQHSAAGGGTRDDWPRRGVRLNRRACTSRRLSPEKLFLVYWLYGAKEQHRGT